MPDEAHRLYFEENPNGNHDKMSRETLEKMNALERRLEAKVDMKMDKKTYWTLFGIQLSLLIGMIGWLASGIEKLNDTVQNTREQVIETRVDMANTKEFVSDLRMQLKDSQLIK